jgi:hypothetical protein
VEHIKENRKDEATDITCFSIKEKRKAEKDKGNG